MVKKYRLLFVLSLVLLAAVIVGISTNYLLGASANHSNQVNITLSDFKIQTSQTSFVAKNTYHFVVTNAGHTNHEFMVMKPMSGQMSMGQMDQGALTHIDQSQLPPGASKSFDFTFPASAGSEILELACHMPGHYEAGMHLLITVKQG